MSYALEGVSEAELTERVRPILDAIYWQEIAS